MTSKATSKSQVGPLVWVGFGALLVYAALILVNANFGPTDDVAFIKTVMRGLPVLAWGPESIALGRFAPVGAQEFNLLLLLDLPKSPYAMFAINVLQFCIVMALLITLLRVITKRTGVIVAIIAAFLLLPGSTISWFRLSVGERDMVFYLAIFVFSYLRFQRSDSWVSMLLALLAGNAVIYCKEPMFMAMGLLAGTHLVATWKSSTPQQRALDGLLMLSAVVFIVLYYFLVHLHRGPHLYSDTQFNAMIVFAKNLANYAFFSDPVIVLVLWPFTVWRLFLLLRSKGAGYSVYDSLLLAGSAYGGAYLLLNMYQPYYLLPAYVFAIPGLAYYFARGAFGGRIWKWIGAGVAAVMVLNTIPAGIHYLSRNKYLAVNYNATVDFMTQDIRSRHPNEQARIFLDGVDRGEGLGSYYILGEFLKYRGLPRAAFDLASNREAVCKDCPIAVSWDLSDDYTVYKRDALPEIKSGDYLIVTPDANTQMDEAYLRSLENEYQLAFKTESDFSVPLITVKTAVKSLLLTLSGSNIDRELMVGRNLRNDPDYFVYVRR